MRKQWTRCIGCSAGSTKPTSSGKRTAAGSPRQCVPGGRPRRKPHARGRGSGGGSCRPASWRCFAEPAREQLAPVLQLVPGRDRRHLQQGAVAARVDVRELARLVLPGDLEPAVLDPLVKPRDTVDELAKPIADRLDAYERKLLHVTH